MSFFINLPMPLRVGVAVLGCGSLMAAFYLLFWMLPAGSATAYLVLMLIALVLVVLALVIYGLVLKWQARRQSQAFGREINNQSAVAPQAVTAAEQRARLDELRRRFDEGTKQFTARGKNLYFLPWYLLVGEAGSGKTECIRRSNIDFPSGLNDEFQGVGGTINMNWWFANDAVILDTAGRMMFEEVQPGQTSEWQEFLRLLRRFRKDCPINGLLLVVPADSLIKDSGEERLRKAEKVAQQLATIQRTLDDLRFPVFVIVTKCDLITGFREFFVNLDDPELQHQMVGWSNPDPLDQPFEPTHLEQHLAQLLARLRKRRFSMLLEKSLARAGNHAEVLGDVDALYAFPEGLQVIYPRLQSYLEKCFGRSSGVWGGKPLFLRGIYFTSSIQEGGALDALLAEALKVPIESVVGDLWKKERSYFLRDLFKQKIFRESGLVTWASNTRQQARTRKTVVLIAALVSVLLLLGFTWYGAVSLSNTVAKHRAYWAAAANPAYWQEAKGTAVPSWLWRPLIMRATSGTPGLDYANPPVDLGQKQPKTSAYLTELHKLVGERIRVPWVFAIARIGRDLNEPRRQAYQTLLTASVLVPITDAAREKLAGETPETWPPEAEAALVELLRVRLHALEWPGAGEHAAPTRPNLAALLNYVLSPVARAEALKDPYREDLQKALDAVFKETEWPPARLAGPPTTAAAAAKAVLGDGALENGLRCYFARQRREAKTTELVDRLAKRLQAVHNVVTPETQKQFDDLTLAGAETLAQEEKLLGTDFPKPPETQADYREFLARATTLLGAGEAAPEGKVPEGKAPEGKAPEGKAPEGAAPAAAAPPGSLAGARTGYARSFAKVNETLQALNKDLAANEEMPDYAKERAAAIEELKKRVFSLPIPRRGATYVSSAPGAALEAQLAGNKGIYVFLDAAIEEVAAKDLNPDTIKKNEEELKANLVAAKEKMKQFQALLAERQTEVNDLAERGKLVETAFTAVAKTKVPGTAKDLKAALAGLERAAGEQLKGLPEAAAGTTPAEQRRERAAVALESALTTLRGTLVRRWANDLFQEVLATAPTTPEAVAQLVHDKGAELRDRGERDPNDLVGSALQRDPGVDLNYQPRAAEQVILGWNAGASLVAKPGVPVLDAAGWTEKMRGVWTAYERYLDDYVKYWTSQVKVQDLDVKALAWPRLQFVDFEAAGYVPTLNPAFVRLVVRSWELFLRLQEQDVPVVKSGDLQTDYEKAVKAYTDFWSELTLEGAGADVKTWRDFCKLDRRELRRINFGLTELGDIMTDAVTPLTTLKDRKALPKSMAEAVAQIALSVTTGKETLKKERLDYPIEEWEGLGAEELALSRNKVLDLVPKEFADKYLVLADPDHPDFTRGYWEMVTLKVLESFAEDCRKVVRDEAQKAAAELVNYTDLFPFNLESPVDLKPTDLGRVRDALAKLQKVIAQQAEAEAKRTIRSGARYGLPTVDKQLEKLREVPLPPLISAREELTRLADLLAGLPKDENETLPSRVLLLANADQNKEGDNAVNYWRVIRVSQGRVGDPIGSIQEADTALGSFLYPAAEVTFDFFLTPKDYDQGTKDRTVVLPGPWSCLHLLQRAAPPAAGKEPPGFRCEPLEASADGKQWRVRMLVNDKGKERALLLQVNFERPLPKRLTLWPSLKKTEAK